MPKTRQLLRETITYSEATKREVNLLPKLTYVEKRDEYFRQIGEKTTWIQSMVAHHLGLKDPGMCEVADTFDWIHGSFNVCIPVQIEKWESRRQPGQRVMFRLPLPYRVGDAFRPGNGDEKLRCEAGTYAWLQQNCPDVPIPRLYGFALSTGETFTQIDYLPFFPRLIERLRRGFFSWVRRPAPSPYVRHQAGSHVFDNRLERSGYLLIEYVEEEKGQMLSTTWLEKKEDPKLRNTFFRDFAKIMLSVSKVPMQRIGSWTIDNDGYLRLANRPLSIMLQDLENEEIPTDIPRDYTYTSADSFALDIIRCHDNRIRHQPNAVNDLGDAIYQTSALTAMRALLPFFFTQKTRHGPFVFSLTDLHASNIFVDEDWHITSLVDLEWACSHPIEFIRPPYWFSQHELHLLKPEELAPVRQEFVDILAEEETSRKNTDQSRSSLSEALNELWEIGAYWYTLALESPTGLFHIYYNRVQKQLDRDVDDIDHFTEIMTYLWSRKPLRQIAIKVSDKEDYDADIRKAFDVTEEEAEEIKNRSNERETMEKASKMEDGEEEENPDNTSKGREKDEGNFVEKEQDVNDGEGELKKEILVSAGNDQSTEELKNEL